MIEVMSFEIKHDCIEMLDVNRFGYIVHNGEFMVFCGTFPDASEAMDILILKMLEGRDKE